VRKKKEEGKVNEREENKRERKLMIEMTKERKNMAMKDYETNDDGKKKTNKVDERKWQN
jgi:hypothetical protein